MKRQLSIDRILSVTDIRSVSSDWYSELSISKLGFIYCQAGCIEITSGNRCYVIRPGDAYVYTFSTFVHTMHKSNDVEGLVVDVDLNFILPIINKVLNVESQQALSNQPFITLTPKQRNRLDSLLCSLTDAIQEERAQQDNLSYKNLQQELIKSLGQTLCYEIVGIYLCNTPQTPLRQDKKDGIVFKFILSLYRYYRQEREVAFYAKKQNLTPRYFSAIIKQKTGETAQQWIVRFVITEAEQLLENTDLSVKEIATRLSFSTQSVFGKYFKLYVGMSPKAYKNKVY